jgi:hypothetical protein
MHRPPDAQHDVPAAPAVPTVWAAARDVLLAPEVDDPIAALPGRYLDPHFIQKHVRLGGL